MTPFDMIDDGFRRVLEGLKAGKFQRHDLEAIIAMCDQIKATTQKTLDKGPVTNGDRK